MLQFDVPSYCFRCNLVSSRSYKVHVVLQSPFARTVPQRIRQKDVHILFHYFHSSYLQFTSLINSLQSFLQSFSNICLNNQPLKLRCLTKTLLLIVDFMLTTQVIIPSQFRRCSVIFPLTSWGGSNGGAFMNKDLER